MHCRSILPQCCKRITIFYAKFTLLHFGYNAPSINVTLCSWDLSRTRVTEISFTYAELENALPNSCPTFEAVLQFVEWTLVNNAHGQLMSIDMHLHQRVMDEFLVRGATRPTV